MKKTTLSFFFLIIGFQIIFAQYKLSSPDGNIEVQIDVLNEVLYSVKYKDKQIIDFSTLGFTFKNQPALGSFMEVVDMEKNERSEEWEPVTGNRSIVKNHYIEIVLELKEKKFPKRNMQVIFRAYNDGVAFRYFLPGDKNFITTITDELTTFRFRDNYQAWIADYGSYVSHQESEFREKKISNMDEGSFAGLPMLMKLQENIYAAITEADIDDWPGFYLARKTNTPPDDYVLYPKLSPIPESPNVDKVIFRGSHYSPWRVIMIGDTPGDLIESEIIVNLNDPCAIEDPSWIKPGLCAWDHWWSGGVVMDTETIKEYIQLASDMGWPYMLIDWQWYGPYNRPDADITTVAPSVDMDEVRSFAAEKNVRLWLWLYWSDAARNYEDAFALYEEWGIAGVKIDFMQRDDQEMVNWYHDIVKKAADHHLLVNFHGSYKPDGFRRTYPNLMTREGVLGNEYSKWSKRITPEHNITIAFTRMLAGPLDYTPGGFLNKTPEEFRPGSPAFVMNTRAHQLAAFLVYESPVITVCDHPDHYNDEPGIDFLKNVPATWDDTKVLGGEPGEYICIARKKGKRWYMGILNNSFQKEIEVSLSFMDEGRYNATIFADSEDGDVHPEKLEIKSFEVTDLNRLSIQMAPGGGFAGWFEGQEPSE